MVFTLLMSHILYEDAHALFLSSSSNISTHNVNVKLLFFHFLFYDFPLLEFFFSFSSCLIPSLSFYSTENHNKKSTTIDSYYFLGF